MTDNRRQERREVTTLSQDQMDEIAERAAAHALKLVYQEVGKNIVKKFFWLVGAFALGIVFMAGRMNIKWPF